MITEIERNNAFDQSTETAQYLYSNPEAGRRLRRIFATQNLSEDKYKDYAIAVGDVILGLHPIKELPQLLQHEMTIEEQIARNLTTDLLDFLSPLSPADQVPANRSQQLTPASLTSAVPAAAPPDIATLTKKIQIKSTVDEPTALPPIEEPAPMPAPEPIPEPPVIEPVHTMQSDIDILRARRSALKTESDLATPPPPAVPGYAKPMVKPGYNDTDPSRGNPR